MVKKNKISSFVKMLFTCSLIFAGYTMSFAQDVHYTQFSTLNQSLNPALTGNFEHDWQAGINYRNQWRSIAIPAHPFVTTSFAYEQKVPLEGHDFSAGIYYVNDKSGAIALVQQKVIFSLAYHKTIAENNIHVGLQPGIIMKNFNTDGITFPEDWSRDQGMFISGTSTINPLLNNKLSYFDLNGGAAWDRDFGKYHPTVGFSLFHLTKPSESFTSIEYKLPVRSMFYSSCLIDFNPKYLMNVRLLQTFMNKASEILLSIEPEININKNKQGIRSIFAGISSRTGFSRNADAFATMLGITFKNTRAAISYDFNISPLKQASNYKGGFEFSLIYRGLNTNEKSKAVPCDVY